MLKVGDIIKGTAVDIDFKGQGVVKKDDYVIFVKKMIKGEEAKIKITKLKKSFGQGEITELLVQSDDRVNDNNSKLGSCSLIHLSVAQQLVWQKQITQDTIKKISGNTYDIEETMTNYKDKFYRNKVVFHVIDTPFLTLGLYNNQGDKLIQVNGFVLADKKINEVMKHLGSHKMIINPRVFKHLVFRTNSNSEVLITLVAKKELFLGRDELVNFLKNIDGVVGITVNINDSIKRILGEKSITLFGKNIIVERLDEYDIFINDRSFFQTNLEVIKKAYQIIENEIKSNSIIIDAYSGVGSIGFYLNNKSKRTVMIEANKESAKMAKMTKRKYELDHIEIIDELAEKVIHLIDADYLIVDPPRGGLRAEFIASVLKKEFKKVFYLSCDVKTLTRDLVLLSEEYSIKNIYPIKMFFHTTSLETLVVLEKK